MRQARVPWAEPKSRFTLMFERFAIDVLRETDVLGATRILRISWDQAHHLMQRAVARGLARREQAPIKYVGIDEKAIAKRHRYATLLNDLEHGVVLEVVDGRTVSQIEMLGPEGRVDELARMLGGTTKSDAARTAARELLGRGALAGG